MLIQPDQRDELTFAWCYRVYYRWRTHRAAPQPALAKLDGATLGALLQDYDVHVLEATASEADVKLLASLLPTETVAAGVSKAKGRVSKWLREQLHLQNPRKLLSRGYFASTAGQSTAEAVQRYLEQQGEHHGYASRVHPPVFVQRYPITAAARRDEPAAAYRAGDLAAKRRLRRCGRLSHRRTLAADAGRTDDGPGKGLVRTGSRALGGAGPSERLASTDGDRADERSAGTVVERFSGLSDSWGCSTALAAQRLHRRVRGFGIGQDRGLRPPMGRAGCDD